MIYSLTRILFTMRSQAAALFLVPIISISVRAQGYYYPGGVGLYYRDLYAHEIDNMVHDAISTRDANAYAGARPELEQFWPQVVRRADPPQSSGGVGGGSGVTTPKSGGAAPKSAGTTTKSGDATSKSAGSGGKNGGFGLGGDNIYNVSEENKAKIKGTQQQTNWWNE